jgi:hypothetical protein
MTLHCRTLLLAACAAMAPAAVAGDIYRCVAANGEIAFTNIACPAQSRVEHVASYDPVPDEPPPVSTPQADAAAASAERARAAAQEAQAAAREAQFAYEQAQSANAAEPAAEAEGSTLLIPYYVPYRAPAHGAHHRSGRRHAGAPTRPRAHAPGRGDQSPIPFYHP